MEASWTTLYDVSRDGIGVIPWFLAASWIAGIIAGGIAYQKSLVTRRFLVPWLIFWCAAGGLGYGNVFHQYAANLRALKAGSCETVEGPIQNLHRENPMKKGDSEHFVVSGRAFQYSSGNLGGSGLRSSRNFKVPLKDGLYVKIWVRRGIICRLDAAASRLSSSFTP